MIPNSFYICFDFFLFFLFTLLFIVYSLIASRLLSMFYFFFFFLTFFSPVYRVLIQCFQTLLCSTFSFSSSFFFTATYRLQILCFHLPFLPSAFPLFLPVFSTSVYRCISSAWPPSFSTFSTSLLARSLHQAYFHHEEWCPDFREGTFRDYEFGERNE